MQTSEKHELITLMKSQHLRLTADLAQLRSVASGAAPTRALLEQGLQDFARDLQEHLKLEDETFYPAYVSQIEQTGGDMERVLRYQKEMQTIAKAVGIFLSTALAHEGSDIAVAQQFIPELDRIAEILVVRIETEEEGPYRTFLEEV